MWFCTTCIFVSFLILSDKLIVVLNLQRKFRLGKIRCYLMTCGAKSKTSLWSSFPIWIGYGRTVYAVPLLPQLQINLRQCIYIYNLNGEPEISLGQKDYKKNHKQGIQININIQTCVSGHLDSTPSFLEQAQVWTTKRPLYNTLNWLIDCLLNISLNVCCVLQCVVNNE